MSDMHDWKSWAVAFLLNALWQAPLLFATAWLAARLARSAGPRWEHRIWVSALALQILVPAISIDAFRTQIGSAMDAGWAFLASLWISRAVNGATHVVIGPAQAAADGWLHVSSPVVDAILMAYAASILYFSARMLWGLSQCMTHAGIPFRPTEADRQLQEKFRMACQRAGVRHATIAISAGNAGPQTIGILRPRLLLSRAFADQVSESDLDAVLAHELAHMRRQDFAKNLLYTAISLPLGFHPITHLVRQRITATREMVCDALAAEASPSAESYARSLLRLAAMMAHLPARTNLHAIGIFDANIFERRVMTLLKKSPTLNIRRRLAIVAACASLGLIVCASAVALRVELSASGVNDQQAAKKVHVDVKKLTLVSQLHPVYPVEAKKNKIQGDVELTVLIGTGGEVEHISVLSGPKELQQSALDAVRHWKWQPFLLNGDPVEVETTVHVIYSLAG